MNKQQSTELELLLGAIGEVLGDILTSVYYVVSAVILGMLVLQPTINSQEVIGFTSLIICTLIFVHIKYIIISLRALNNKAGGIQPLAGLITSHLKVQWQKTIIKWSSAFSTCLLIADAALTPAITLLSATAGLATDKALGSSFDPYVLPLAAVLAIVVALSQKFPRVISIVSGPINIAFCLMIATLGIKGIIMSPEILQAINPWMAFRFLIEHSWSVLIPVFGYVFLSATGGEALYADAEHFGPKAIKKAWYFAETCLILNYLGQGGYVLQLINHNQTINGISIFFGLFPDGWLFWPCFLIGTGAAVNASLALFPAIHSNWRFAVVQGLTPRISMKEENANHKGQLCSWLIVGFMLTLILIIMFKFKRAEALEAAYGISIIIAMVITDIFFKIWAIVVKKWKPIVALTVFGIFLTIDSMFLWANVHKIPDGGWVTLVIAGSLFMPMTLWSHYRNKTLKAIKDRGAEKTFGQLRDVICNLSLAVSNGVDVYMHRVPNNLPMTFWRKLEVQKEVKIGQVTANLLVRKINLFLCVAESQEEAHVDHEKRILSFNKFTHDGALFVEVVIRFGFYHSVQIVNEIFDAICDRDPELCEFKHDDIGTRYFFGREQVYDNRNIVTRFGATVYNLMSKSQPRPQFGIKPEQIEHREFDLNLAPKYYQQEEVERLKDLTTEIINGKEKEEGEEVIVH